MSQYDSFLETKRMRAPTVGFAVSADAVHPLLFPFQRDIVCWALRKGRAAVFADCGLGKTFIQLEWARLLGCRTLIIAPLSVARQTVREGCKLGIDVHYTRSVSDVVDGINITNYDIVRHFDASIFGAVVLDESSLLKSVSGSTRHILTDMFADTPYRLCCTATPAPNDYVELGNHAEFLGICTEAEMRAMFFINANKEHTIVLEDKVYRRKGSNKAGQEWRLKHAAERPFFHWLASWAFCLTTPSDLGYDDDGFILPPLEITPHFVEAEGAPDGQLFFTGLHGIQDRVRVRRQTVLQRLAACVKIITEDINAKRGDTCRSKTLSADENTCGNTISNTESNKSQSKGQNENPSQLRRKSIEIESARNGSVGIEKLSKLQRENTTPSMLMPCEPIESNGDMALSCGNISDSSRNKAAAALSAGPHTIRLSVDSSSITTTRAEQSEDCSVSSATMESGHLATAPSDYSWLQSISADSLDKWVVWCGLDEEQRLLESTFGLLCVSIYGSLSSEEKERREALWREGAVPIMLTKLRVMGFGMNWQCAHRMMFFGMNDSWESWYQAIRREWRYGQRESVQVHAILSDYEAEIWQNVMRKDAMAMRLRRELIAHVRDYEREELAMRESKTEVIRERTVRGANWTAMQGDSCERLKEIADDSIDLSLYSPPFADLFTYSDSPRDLGNSRGWSEFFSHYGFIVREVLRVTKPGRLTCVHAADVAAMLERDGYIGIRDFPGEVIRAHEREGWIYHGRTAIDKNPQAQALRTHAKNLLFAQLEKDSCWSRSAIADYILVFRKPGLNAVPVQPVANGELNRKDWILWARPIWYAADYAPGTFQDTGRDDYKSGASCPGGIRETDTLQFAAARGADDEKHICPLQLGTIERCIKLYSNPSELVLSPFMGIGSEGYQAVRFRRRFVGCELKESYFEVAVKHLRQAEAMTRMPDLFSL